MSAHYVKNEKPQAFKSPAGSWAGRGEILGDIVHTDDYIQWDLPELDEDLLSALRERFGVTP